MKTKNYFQIIFVLFLLPFFSCSSGNEKVISSTSPATIDMVKFSDTGITKLMNNQVCMINNKFMNSDQIVVQSNDKIYYGCCEGCVKALKENSTSHYAIDPLSYEQVDKAIAFIIGKPGTKDNVLYFKSEINAREYFNKNFQPKL